MQRKVLFLVALCLGSSLAQADGAKPFFTLHDLGHGVWAAVALPTSGAGSNAGFVVGSDSVAVIDTFTVPEAAQALLTEISKVTKFPVRYVIDTHYHLDHTGGNGVFQQAGAVVMAERNVRGWERSENLKVFGDKITPEQKHMVESLTLPSVVYGNDVEIYLGERRLVVRVMNGHTGGDSIVAIPDAQVVFTGDLFWDHCLPNLIDASVPVQTADNDVFLRDYPTATFVPGHGEVGKADDVRAFRGYLAHLYQAVGNAQGEGKSGQALVDALLPGLKKEYGSWGFFDHFIQRNIEQTAAELAGTKRRPVPLP